MIRAITTPFRFFGRIVLGFFRAPIDLAKMGWTFFRSLVSDSRKAVFGGGLREAVHAETVGRRLDVDTILLLQRRARFGFAFLLFAIAMVPVYAVMGGTVFDVLVAMMLLATGVVVNLVSLFGFSVACGRKASFISNLQFYIEDTQKMLKPYIGDEKWSRLKKTR
jgi:hypothetical protein